MLLFKRAILIIRYIFGQNPLIRLVLILKFSNIRAKRLRRAPTLWTRSYLA